MSIDLNFFGKKLKKIREQLDCNFEEIELNTGLNKERLEKYESGSLEPSGDDILILADFFKCDYNYFISGDRFTTYDNTEKLFRKYGTEFSKEDKWAIQEFLFLCENEDYITKNLELPIKPFVFNKNTNFEKQQGIDAAKELRIHLGYCKYNEFSNDIYSDFRKLGFHIFRKKLFNSGISGLCLLHKDIGKCILINYNEDIYRQRFSLAHEAGHAILDDLEEDINVSFEKDKNDNYSEIRANNFASHFLIPEEFLNYLKKQNFIWNDNLLIKYTSLLRVNHKTFIFALNNARIINNQIKNELLKIRPLKSDKYNEELTNDLPQKIRDAKSIVLQKGLSTYYVRNCYEAYHRGIISLSKLSEMLLTTESEISELLNLFNLKIIYGN